MHSDGNIKHRICLTGTFSKCSNITASPEIGRSCDDQTPHWEGVLRHFDFFSRAESFLVRLTVFVLVLIALLKLIRIELGM